VRQSRHPIHLIYSPFWSRVAAFVGGSTAPSRSTWYWGHRVGKRPLSAFQGKGDGTYEPLLPVSENCLRVRVALPFGLGARNLVVARHGPVAFGFARICRLAGRNAESSAPQEHVHRNRHQFVQFLDVGSCDSDGSGLRSPVDRSARVRLEILPGVRFANLTGGPPGPGEFRITRRGQDHGGPDSGA